MSSGSLDDINERVRRDAAEKEAAEEAKKEAAKAERDAINAKLALQRQPPPRPGGEGDGSVPSPSKTSVSAPVVCKQSSKERGLTIAVGSPSAHASAARPPPSSSSSFSGTVDGISFVEESAAVRLQASARSRQAKKASDGRRQMAEAAEEAAEIVIGQISLQARLHERRPPTIRLDVPMEGPRLATYDEARAAAVAVQSAARGVLARANTAARRRMVADLARARAEVTGGSVTESIPGIGDVTKVGEITNVGDAAANGDADGDADASSSSSSEDEQVIGDRQAVALERARAEADQTISAWKGNGTAVTALTAVSPSLASLGSSRRSTDERIDPPSPQPHSEAEAIASEVRVAADWSAKCAPGTSPFLDYVASTIGTHQQRAAAAIAMGAAAGTAASNGGGGAIFAPPLVSPLSLAPPQQPPVASAMATCSSPAVTAAASPATPSSQALAAAMPFVMPRTPLPSSALELLDELGLGKYRKRFVREDLTEVAMFTAMLRLGEGGASDLRAILREVGMTLGHRERLLLAAPGLRDGAVREPIEGAVWVLSGPGRTEAFRSSLVLSCTCRTACVRIRA